MSRIGKKPVDIPSGVNVTLLDNTIKVKAPKGELQWAHHFGTRVSVAANSLVVERADDTKKNRALHGLTRNLIANMVTGVTQGFEKKMEIIAVGFRADLQGNLLKLTLGFSHPVLFPIPAEIKVEVDKQTLITVKGVNKQLVGTVAAKLRSIKPPEPYKGKGIRYLGEKIRKKVGKTKALGEGSLLKMENKKIAARMKRKKRVRSRIRGTSERPRLNVFRSPKHIYAQLPTACLSSSCMTMMSMMER